MTKKTNISVVIISFNEEKNIERCLDSVKEIADDIVVLDSFSTDTTEAICLSKGARFVQHIFDGHIEQKNKAITYAKYPYILSLDADEALDERLVESIKLVKNNWEKDGYTMNRLTNYCGKWVKHCGWYPDTKLRLWDSSKGKWTGTNPHDEYTLENGSKIGHLKGNILHYSYYSLEDHDKQIAYFTDIASKAHFKQGKKSTIFQIIFSPIVKFIQSYILKLGFLDGYYGFVICRKSAYASYLKYKKINLLEKGKTL